MSFIDTSVINASIANKGATAAASAQQSILTTVAKTSSEVSKSVLTTVTGKSSTTTNVSTTNSQSLENRAIAAVSSVANSYLQAAKKSILGTFSTSKTGLASVVSPLFSGVFKDTNVKSASTTVTRISDPISTNLLDKKTPTSSGFKVTSAETGSQAIGVSGSSSKVGSGADTMTGTTLSSVLGRFKLDSVGDILSSVTDSFKNDKFKGLFSTLSLPDTSKNTINGITSQVTLDGSSSKSNLLFSAKDLDNFKGNASPLESVLGADLTQYFVTDPNHSLLDDNNNLVNTNKSGVDATSANALIKIIQIAGCGDNLTDYTSLNEKASLYNLGLNFSAKNAMLRELNALLGCSHTSSALGQRSLLEAFLGSSNSQLGSARTILDHIETPTVLNSDATSKTILSNPNLKASDVGSVDYILTTIGTSTRDSLSVSKASSNTYKVMDLDKIAEVSPLFVDGVFGRTMTDFVAGEPISIAPDGGFNFG